MNWKDSPYWKESVETLKDLHEFSNRNPGFTFIALSVLITLTAFAIFK